jgi:hypothetical protein
MDQSLVYRRIHFLRELGQANKTTIKLLVRYMTREQMEALAKVAGYIVRGSIRVLPQDAANDFFDAVDRLLGYLHSVQLRLIKGTLYGVTDRII